MSTSLSSIPVLSFSTPSTKSFPTERRVNHRPIGYATPISEVRSWSNEVGVVLGPLCPADIHDDVLRLLYTYRHLQGGKLDDLPPTDLIQHRVRLKPGTQPKFCRPLRIKSFGFVNLWNREFVGEYMNAPVLLTGCLIGTPRRSLLTKSRILLQLMNLA